LTAWEDPFVECEGYHYCAGYVRQNRSNAAKDEECSVVSDSCFLFHGLLSPYGSNS